MAATYFSTMLDYLLDIAWSPIRDFNNCPAYIDGISESVIEDDGGGDEVARSGVSSPGLCAGQIPPQ